MKKLIAILLTLTLALTALMSCNNKQDPDDETVIRIGYMQGPTGMGMAKLIHDNGGTAGNAKYTFEKFGNVNDATAALIAGQIDMACLPTNNAAAIYNTQDNSIQVLALNCLNSLYVMTKTGTTVSSIEDLEDKTVYTIASGTPKVILQHIIDELGLDVTIKTSATINNEEKALTQPSDLASAMIAGAVDIALVPEPVATSAPLKISTMDKDYNYSVALDLTNVWASVSETPVAMGCIMANTAFVEAHKTITNTFLDEYKASIEYMSDSQNLNDAATYIVEASVLDAEDAAKQSLTNLGDAIAYIDGDEMKSVLVDFYNAIDPSLIGGELPDDGFYYKK